MENASQGLICCCGTSSWTKFIGCFQLAVNAIGMILVVMFLLSMTGDSSATTENIYGSSPEVTLVIAFGVLVLGFIMGMVLLIGTSNSNPKYLKVWITYTTIYIALGIMAGVLKCFTVSSSEEVLVYLVDTTIYYGIQGFFLWVVRVHLNEIALPSGYTSPV